jgi:hypothetical protein
VPRESLLMEYKFLRVCPQQIELVNKAYAEKYPSLLAGEITTGLSWKTVRKFLRGERVRRQTFLRLCAILGISPMAIAGLELRQQPGLATPAEEMPLVPMDLRNAEYEQLLLFMAQQKELGRIVTFMGHDSNVYHYVSAELTPQRLGGGAPQKVLKNKSSLESWAKTGSLEGYLNMRQYLERDGFISGYVYRLIRPTDGALLEYSSDFYLVDDLMGQKQRICCSNPKDYRIISA